MDIKEIIRRAGGRTAVNVRVGKADAARRWERGGIPDIYWHEIMAMVPGLTEVELFAANQTSRKKYLVGSKAA